ncbi:hypothetical protein CHUAL_001257 [Chamberlinius hualienensis]
MDSSGRNHSLITVRLNAQFLNLLQRCRWLMLLLKVGGVDTNFTEDGRGQSFCLLWCLRILVLITSTINLIYQIISMTNGISTDDLWIFTFSDHLFVLAFLYVIFVREKKIKNMTIDVMQISISMKNAKSENLIKKLGKTSTILSLIAITLVINLPIYVASHVILVIDCEQWFSKYYFDIHVESKMIRGLVVFITEASYAFNALTVQIYAAYIIFIIYLMNFSYKSINESFKQMEIISLDNLVNFQRKHQKLNELVNQFNRLFSPAVLTLILVLTGQIIGIPDNIKTQIYDFSVFNKPTLIFTTLMWSNMLFPIFRSVYIFFILFQMSSCVQEYSKEAFDEVLNASLNHSELYEDKMTRNLVAYGSKINLFSFRWLASPTAITASGLFTVDLTLIGVIISVTITYWTLLSDYRTYLSTPFSSNFTCFH